MRARAPVTTMVLIALGACRIPFVTTTTPDAGTNPPDTVVDAGGSLVERPIRVERVFPTDAQPGEVFPSCQLASPLLGHHQGAPVVVVVTGEEVAGLDPATGDARFRVVLPAPDDEMAFAVSTPALVDDTLFVTYHTTARPPVGEESTRDVLGERFRHLVAAVDVQAGALDARYAPLELTGEVPTNDGTGVVPFMPGNALGRSRLVVVDDDGDDGAEDGRLVVTFGNARDIQPWHGFAFEIDLARWRDDDAPITGFLVTTPEGTCGPDGSSGSRDRRCGGGLWAPSGPLVARDRGGAFVVFAPGNGQLDLARGDYANTLMRVRAGLAFDPGCDPALCAALDVDDPSHACLASCRDLFVPRTPEGEPLPAPADGRCEGKTMLECWALLDYIGGSTPARVVVDGHPLFVYPTKDGFAYLVDGEHMGTQHDREELVPICGTLTSPCAMDWAGMSVTEPLVLIDDDDGAAPLVLVPTFMPDGEQVAGVVALRVTKSSEGYALDRVYEVPSFDDPAATARFRRHPGRLARVDIEGHAHAFLVETRPGTGVKARLIGFDVDDGTVVADVELAGRGYRFTAPLVVDDTLYFPSCASDMGPSFLEAWRVSR